MEHDIESTVVKHTRDGDMFSCVSVHHLLLDKKEHPLTRWFILCNFSHFCGDGCIYRKGMGFGSKSMFLSGVGNLGFGNNDRLWGHKFCANFLFATLFVFHSVWCTFADTTTYLFSNYCWLSGWDVKDLYLINWIHQIYVM